MSEWPQVITALTALCAVVVGPVIGYVVSQRTLRAEITAKSRQAWIDGLRDELSKFVGELSVANSNGESGGTVADPENCKKLYELQAKIGLFLNLSEQEHKSLFGAVTSALGHVEFHGKSFMKSDCEDIIAAAGPIFKVEWSKVKRLKQ